MGVAVGRRARLDREVAQQPLERLLVGGVLLLAGEAADMAGAPR
jgi:hypothetical protein